MPNHEPFGYFRAEPFGWTDCAETDEGAAPLYDQDAVDALERERDELALIIATDTGTEGVVADIQRQLVAMTAERDELKTALKLATTYHEKRCDCAGCKAIAKGEK